MHGGALLSTTEAAAVAVAVAAMDPRNAAGVRSGRQVMEFFNQSPARPLFHSLDRLDAAPSKSPSICASRLGEYLSRITPFILFVVPGACLLSYS
jgi:hypothetical protein